MAIRFNTCELNLYPLEVRAKSMKEYNAKTRLEYLREQIEKEGISYGEIAELQSLAKYIEAGDVVLLEWSGVLEFKK